MTTEIDPIRWTASPDEAPELLRAPLAAAAKEGPSAAQMRMLALKLAAVSAGAATAATASTAQASASATGAIATVPMASLPLAKIVAAVAIVGVAAWGGVSMLAPPSARQGEQQARATVEATTRRVDQAVKRAPGSDGLLPTVPAPIAAEPTVAGVPVVEQLQDQAATQTPTPVIGSSAKSARGAVIKTVKPAVPAKVATAPAAPATREAHENTGKLGAPSEMELLRRARAALAGRPRDAYALTEQHREHYPRGLFAQERDALAIEALLRAGDTEAARGLARKFVSAHPDSPHAHRFRETLGLR